MCLRSQVNLTETISSLVMITKAGVPSNQVVVGVTSYGRSFAMADPACSGPECFYTGGPYNSQATPGKCTATGGYISDAEINEILEGSTTNGLRKRSSRVNQHYLDPTSNSDILIYDNNQWVAYMSPKTKASRQSLYETLNMGGTTDWATDLQTYNDPPTRGGNQLVENWPAWKTAILNNQDPWQVGNRTGNWTELDCNDRAVQDRRFLSPSERWNRIDAPNAWADAIELWKNVDRGTNYSFTASISDTLDGPELVGCNVLTDTTNCVQTMQCTAFDTNSAGPAGYMIWNSLVFIHEVCMVCPTRLTYPDNSSSCTEATIQPCSVPPPRKLATPSTISRTSSRRYLNPLTINGSCF